MNINIDIRKPLVRHPSSVVLSHTSLCKYIYIYKIINIDQTKISTTTELKDKSAAQGSNQWEKGGRVKENRPNFEKNVLIVSAYVLNFLGEKTSLSGIVFHVLQMKCLSKWLYSKDVPCSKKILFSDLRSLQRTEDNKKPSTY